MLVASQLASHWARSTEVEAIGLLGCGEEALPFFFENKEFRLGFDGALCANVLHFVPEAGAVLAALARRLRPAGRVVVVEYDREHGSRWVPHPVPRSAIRALADGAGLGSVEVVGERASRFGGALYVAVLQR